MTALALPDQRDERASPVPGGYLVTRSPGARVCEPFSPTFEARQVREGTPQAVCRYGGSGAVIGRLDPLAADRPVVRDLEGRSRLSDALRIFSGFNGHDTHWTRFAVPMPSAPRPSCPRCAREGCAPDRAQWFAPLAATRADPRACSALLVRPRTATSTAAGACRPPRAPRERPDRCLTGERHARTSRRRSVTPRQGAAPSPLPPRRSRTRPQAIAHRPAH